MHRCQPLRGIQGGILSEERRNQTVQHVKKIVRDILTYWDQQVFPRRPRPTATSIFELLTIVPEIDALACMRDPSEEAAAARQRFLEISMAPQPKKTPFPLVDAASVARMLSNNNLQVKSEVDAAAMFLSWAEVSGRTVPMIDRIAPLVRWPLMKLFPASSAIKEPLRRVMERSPAVKTLLEEALAVQMKPAAALSTYTPIKLKLIDGEMATVPRLKKRKHCETDTVPQFNLSDAVGAMLG